ncbi:MAG: hypothetical protein ACI4WH_08645 [Oscillospiraceae bacterium]
MKISKYVLPITIIFLMWSCCNFANSISMSIRESINVCLVAIIPSMYAFMIVSDLFIKSNSHKLIGKVISPISRYVLHLDGQLFAIFLVSLVAGYPVGAKLISTLENGNYLDRSKAENMYCYCYSGGLAFIIGTVGTGFKNGLKIALIIYISNIIANLILAIILNFKSKIPSKDNSKIEVSFSSDILIDSINSSFKTMVNICIMIIAFSILISLLDGFKISQLISIGLSKILNISESSAHSILNGLLEISRTSQVNVIGRYYLPTLAFMFSFGGVCVILQIVSISSNGFKLSKFLKCRLLTGIISFIICDVFSKIFLKDDLMVVSNYTPKVTEEKSIIPTICLICMSFILLSKNTKYNYY